MSFNSYNKDKFEIRPEFKLISNCPKVAVINRLKFAWSKQNLVDVVSKDNFFALSIPITNQHFWSPKMEVLIHDFNYDKSKSLIKCKVGPKLSVWVKLFMVFLVFGISALLGCFYLVEKLNLGMDSLFLCIVSLASLLAVLVYFTAKFGQKKARNQILYLVRFLYHAVEDVDRL